MDVSPTELRKTHRIALILTGANILVLLVLTFVFEMLSVNGNLTARQTELEPYVLPVLAGAVAISYLVIQALRLRLLQQAIQPGANQANIFKLGAVLQNLLRLTIIGNAFAEACALLGFIAAFLTGKGTYLYAGLVLAAALFWVFFPRRSQWEEWTKTVNS